MIIVHILDVLMFSFGVLLFKDIIQDYIVGLKRISYCKNLLFQHIDEEATIVRDYDQLFWLHDGLGFTIDHKKVTVYERVLGSRCSFRVKGDERKVLQQLMIKYKLKGLNNAQAA